MRVTTLAATPHLTPRAVVESASKYWSLVPTARLSTLPDVSATSKSPLAVTIVSGIAASAVATPAVKKVASSPVSTCLIDAPAVWAIAVVPAFARTTVSVSLDTLVTHTISSLSVSTSSATANESTLPAASVTPPIRAEPVPVATTMLVAVLFMPDASDVETEVELNFLVIV